MPASISSGGSDRAKRDAAIAGFRDGSINVLVNVIAAAMGFDQPDASCVIIARSSLRLASYLQMVSLGLRPKPDGPNRLILGMVANS